MLVWDCFQSGGRLSLLGTCLAGARGQVLLGFFLLLSTSCSFAGEPPIRFESVLREGGLSLPATLTILQDQTGFMWFGTWSGLFRYDGYDFREYKKDPPDPYSLSNSYVYTLWEDPNGFLWIGTFGGGINRFDPRTQRFKSWMHDDANPNGLSYNDVTAMIGGDNGVIWVGTLGGGLNKFHPETGTFEVIQHKPEDQSGLSDNNINDLIRARSGEIYIATVQGGVCRLDPKTHQITRYLHDQNDPKSLAHNYATSLYEDPRGRIWVGTLGGGLSSLDPDSGTFRTISHQPDQLAGPASNNIWSLQLDHNGYLWIGTQTDGLMRMDPKDRGFINISHDPSDRFGIAHDFVFTIFEDRAGTMWFGTVGGISKYEPSKQIFKTYRHQPENSNSLTASDVNAVFGSRDGVIWVGTSKGLNRFDYEEGLFSHYLHDPKDPDSISDNYVRAIYEDQLGRLWVGTRAGGLNLMDRTSETFSHFREDPKQPGAISSNFVQSVYEDDAANLWIGTWGGGLNVMNEDGETFTVYRNQLEDPTSLSTDRVVAVEQDSAGRLWVSTWVGLNRFDRETGAFVRYLHDPDQPRGLRSNLVNFVHEDRRGGFWVGTWGGGLHRFVSGDLDHGPVEFEAFTTRDGLPSDSMWGLLEDDDGCFWLCTPYGLTKFNPDTGDVKNFDFTDGVQGDGYNYYPYRHTSGDMFFGGKKGITVFNPGQVVENSQVPDIVVSNFLIANKSVSLRGRDPDSPLVKPIFQTDNLSLSRDDFPITFEFAALHYANPKRNRYAYQLVGLDEDWIHTDAEHRFASYSNLMPGSYTFRVKGCNRDGVWNREGTTIELEIRPAVWQTWWAYTLYVALACAGILFYIRAQRRKLEQERSVNERLKQVDRLKDEFLANTSHELRTPLNGIIGMAESLIDGATGQLSPKTKDHLAMIVSSGMRLANLVNDILDFSKLKHQKLSLTLKPVDLHGIVDVVLTLSQHLIGGKSLQLINGVEEGRPSVYADENRLQQILHNLVGNAVKFTDAGHIKVYARWDHRFVTVFVEDTGIGIPKEKHQSIFESFEQVSGEETRSYGGTGLGLAVTRQLVTLHGGDIWVESSPESGAVFQFTLPVALENSAMNQETRDQWAAVHSFAGESLSADVKHETEPIQPSEVLEVETRSGDQQTFEILVVDDEPVNRQVLINHLSLRHYRVTSVPNGREVLRLLREGVRFDLVLLDVMMPGLSGYHTCLELRKLYSFQDLPVIFLTAKNQISDLVTGFTSGGNDYITKPVSKDELLARVQTHLQLLDINRTLEQKVSDRTKLLELKNQEILKTQDQLIMQEKMASMGTLTAGVAHELRNPLNFINNFANISKELCLEMEELIKRYEPQLNGEIHDELRELVDELDDDTNHIIEHGKRASNIVKSMVELAGGGSSDQEEADINWLVEKFAVMACHGETRDLDTPKIMLEKQLDASIGVVKVSGQDLSRVVINLVNNAVDAIQLKRQYNPGFTPKITIATKDHGHQFSIEIKDNGMGIKADRLDSIFTPFFTTKPSGNGNIGLGLSISYEIVKAHGGTLEVESEEGQYCLFRIRLPKHMN